ncbi:MAG: hypothetical protein ACJAWL_003305 [Motiliproteus sp.]|jgi:hypothetical protein
MFRLAEIIVKSTVTNRVFWRDPLASWREIKND